MWVSGVIWGPWIKTHLVHTLSFYVTSWKPGLPHLEKLTLMDAMGRVHEHAPGPPRVKNILLFCLVCAFNFGHLATVQHFFKLSDLPGVVGCTPFFPTSVWCSGDFYSSADKDTRIEIRYCWVMALPPTLATPAFFFFFFKFKGSSPWIINLTWSGQTWNFAIPRESDLFASPPFLDNHLDWACASIWTRESMRWGTWVDRCLGPQGQTPWTSELQQ